MVIADLGDDTATAAFTPAKNAWPRLKPLGITNHQPATNFLPQVTQEEGREVARYILGHKTSMNQKARAAHSEGTLQVKIAKHKFKGLAEWDKQFTTRKCVKETLDSLEVQREKKIQGDLTGAVDFKSTVVAAVATQPERDGQEFRVLPKSRDSMIPGTTGSTIHQNMVRCTNCGNSKKVRPSQLCTTKGWGRLSCKWQGCHHKARHTNGHAPVERCGPNANTTTTTSPVVAATPLPTPTQNLSPPPSAYYRHQSANDYGRE